MGLDSEAASPAQRELRAQRAGPAARAVPLACSPPELARNQHCKGTVWYGVTPRPAALGVTLTSSVRCGLFVLPFSLASASNFLFWLLHSYSALI